MHDATPHHTHTHTTMKTLTASHVSLAIEYFLGLAEVEQAKYLGLPFDSSAWQFHRDRYVNLSNAAAQLMGETI